MEVNQQLLDLGIAKEAIDMQGLYIAKNRVVANEARPYHYILMLCYS